jgi:OmpR family response regulator RpaB
MSKRKTIMVIDDNVDILTVVERILTADFDVITLNDEEHILDSVREAQPDLLILDILMQTTDGYAKFI